MPRGVVRHFGAYDIASLIYRRSDSLYELAIRLTSDAISERICSRFICRSIFADIGLSKSAINGKLINILINISFYRRQYR